MVFTWHRRVPSQFLLTRGATELISASDETKSSSLPGDFDSDSNCNDQLKAAQAVLKDIRSIFAEKSREAKEAKEAAPKATPAAKRRAKTNAKW